MARIKGTRLRQPRLVDYLICYALYAVIVFVCFESFWLWRSTLEAVFAAVYRHADGFAWAYLISTISIGIILYCVVIGTEGYFRTSIERGGGPLGLLPGRFIRVAIMMGAMTALAVGLQELLRYAV